MIEGLKPYAEYAAAGLPWLDSVPKHWEMVPNRALLREQRDVVGERAADHVLLSLTLDGIIPRNMQNPKGKFPVQFNTYKVVRPDDLVFCLFDIDETPRAVGHSKLNGMITGAYDVFSPRRQVNSRFLYHYYRFVDDRKLMKPLYTGLRKTIQRGVFASLRAPCPPTDEQASIVRFLDHANRKLDRFIRTKRKLIALLNEQKQAVIYRAVTRGLEPNVALKPSGAPWLGNTPARWELVPNRALMKVHKEPVGDKSSEHTLLSLTLRGVVPRDMENPKGKFPAEFSTYQKVRPKDLIFCLFDVDETPRAIGLSSLSGMITGAYTIFECQDSSVGDYLYHFYLAMDERKCLKPLYTGLRKTIPKSRLLGVKTPFPPEDERSAIISHIQQNSKYFDDVIGRTERGINLIREYRTRLTADIVTGKLDVREAAAKLPDLTADFEPLPDVAELHQELPEETAVEVGHE